MQVQQYWQETYCYLKVLMQLTGASELIPKTQAKEIMKLVSDALFEICTAEALEIQLHR